VHAHQVLASLRLFVLNKSPYGWPELPLEDLVAPLVLELHDRTVARLIFGESLLESLEDLRWEDSGCGSADKPR
jgi:hypothetical protein